MAAKPRLSAAARQAARELAVAYHAFWEARERRNDCGIAVWGDLLLRAQDHIGTELLTPSCVRNIVAEAGRRADAKRAAA